MNAATEVTMVPINSLRASPTNPRKTFDQGPMDELTASVLRHGILQPILARFGDKPGGFELIAGERRLRAAKAAGLTEVPVVLRNVTDEEAAEMQVIENLQRSDLHPLDESDGFAQLNKVHKLPVEEIAKRCGKSATYVFQRLKLAALCERARKMFRADQLTSNVAFALARIPRPELQEQAAKEIEGSVKAGGNGFGGGTGTVSWIERKFMLDLDDASFPVNDEKLVPGAGACVACPKRTGNAPMLFGDLDKDEANVCTDPTCFEQKRVAWRTVVFEKATANKQRIIKGDSPEAKKIAPYQSVNESSGYVELKDKCYADAKHRTYKAILGKAAPNPILLEDPNSGDFREIVAVADIAVTMKERVPLWRKNSGHTRDPSEIAREKKAKLETLVRTRVYEAVCAKHSGDLPLGLLQLVAATFLEATGHDSMRFILKVWMPDLKKGGSEWDAKKALVKKVQGMGSHDLGKLLLQLAICGDVRVGTYSTSKKAEQLEAACKTVGVKHELVREAVLAEIKAGAAPKPKAPPKPIISKKDAAAASKAMADLAKKNTAKRKQAKKPVAAGK